MGTIEIALSHAQFFSFEVHPIEKVLDKVGVIVVLVAFHRVGLVVEMFVGQLAKMLSQAEGSIVARGEQ